MNANLRRSIQQVLEEMPRAPEKPAEKSGRWRATIYFDSPVAKWQQRAPAENEILARRAFRWRWFAEVWATARTRGLNYVLWRVDRL